ncbi:hypothetical protein CM19_03235 [Candidatus Acidianus copahuensis]|uniref:Teichoic acid transporter n=1 Tax=Candidatus Acidianus copahuensis TaxID=1160895 RepID=A0A031LTM4_9CREN|nr:membrane protein involved in the export of O-antigen and teichoic acid [Candidatus Acidianus copahuensis]EZQ10859.1 hypothetical protein CM19_03235 [Candidatus Acidianus copahuensis]
MESKKAQNTPGLTRIGIFNLLIKTAVMPFSFLFSLLAVRYLSSISIETFGAWQYIFVLITGYFTIPADLFSAITSRYSSENKPVGGIIILNGLAGALSSIVYVFLIPYFISASHYYEPLYFLAGLFLIVLIYLSKITGSTSLGKSPRVIAISAMAFQLIRLSSGIILMFLLHLSIIAVIFAYSLGYLAQIIINMFLSKANLKVDFKLAIIAARKSLVFIMNYVQLIIEATLVWVVVEAVHSTEPVSYFESALIIANIIIWSQASVDGLILKLHENKDAKIVETALKLFAISSGIFIMLIIVDGDKLLYVLRPEYIDSIFALYVLSVSNFLRGLYSIFYKAIYMKDESLSPESVNEFKGNTASLTVKNVIISAISVSIVSALIFLLGDKGNVEENSPFLALLMSSAVLTNSIGMLFYSFKISKRLYNFSMPTKEFLLPILISIISGFPFILAKTEYGKTLYELRIMTEESILGLTIYVILNLVLNPYAKQLLKSGISFLKNFKR